MVQHKIVIGLLFNVLNAPFVNKIRLPAQN